MHGNHFTGNLPLGEKHFENIVPEDDLYLFQFQRRSDAKHAAVAVKAAVRHEDVAVRIEPEEVTEGLHGDDGAGNGFIFKNRILEKTLQGFPGAAAEGGKELSIIQKVTTNDFRDAKDKMPVRNLLEDVHAQPLPEFHHPLLMA